MTTEPQYLLRIKRGDFEFEVAGDKEFVESKYYEAINKQVNLHKSEVTKPVDTLSITTRKPLSLVEFMKEKNPKSHPTIITCFGYYLEKFKGLKNFGRDELVSCYAEAKMPQSTNTSQMINNAISNGHLMESQEKSEEGKKRYVVTQSGEAFVESTKGGE